MKWFWLGLFVVLTAQAQTTPAQYPKICGSKGPAWMEPAAGGMNKIKVNEILHEKAGFKTENAAVVCVDLSKTDRLIVGENSQVQIPFIELESGLVPEVVVTHGHFRLINESGTSRIVASDLFRETVKKGDYVVSFDRENVLGTMDVLGGEVRFRGLENEETVLLKVGESASFKGDVAEGQVQYDVLLKGKKVARGQLSPMRTLSAAEIDAFKKKLQLAKPKVIRDDAGEPIGEAPVVGGAKKTKDKKKSSRSTDASLICSKPEGKFNECAWVCEKNPRGAKKCLLEKPNVKCIRQRCNANGEWEDRFEFSRDRSPCEAKTIVRACDY